MKKLLTIMLIAVVAVSSAFAISGHIGVSSGYTFNMDLELDEPTKYYSSSVPVLVDGVTYFGDMFGLSFGAEIMDIPMGVTANGTTIKPDKTKVEFTAFPYAGLAFKYDFSDSFALGANLAATFKWDINETTILNKTIKSTYYVVGMMGDLFANVTAGSVNLRFGAKASGDLAAWVSAENVTQKFTELSSIIRVLPYASVGFAF